jgi:hypothetical protein
MEDEAGRIGLALRRQVRDTAGGVSYEAAPSAQVTVTLDPNDGPCFTAQFRGAPGPRCRVKDAGATLRCR